MKACFERMWDILKYTVNQPDGLWRENDIPRWLSELRVPIEEAAFRRPCATEMKDALDREIQEGRVILRSSLSGMPTGSTANPHDDDMVNDNDVITFAKLCGIEIELT